MTDRDTVPEPEIIAQHREQLAYLLTEAAEIEHGLMCCYLFAAYSLKRGDKDGLAPDETAVVERWRKAVVRLAVEEMLHLAIVSNLLASIGFAPQFGRQNFPVTPGYHPSGVVIALAPFSLGTLDHFIFLERPEGVSLPDGDGFEAAPPVERSTQRDRLMPSSEDYATVGHLYRGIRNGFVCLAETLGERALFAGVPAAQVGPEILDFTGLFPVTDLASATRAIDVIVEQGEGTAVHSEQSHYARFLAVRNEYRSLLETRPGFTPAHPVARNPVMRKPQHPEGRVHVDEPKAARLLDLGNALYGLALRMLARVFGQADDSQSSRRVLADAAIEVMTMISPVGELLARMPARAEHPGVNAGLSFAMARSNMGSPRSSVWPLLVERTLGLAAGFSSAAVDIDPSLGEIAGRLKATAARLESAASP